MSRATPQIRGDENRSRGLVHPYDVDELSDTETEPNEYLEPQADILDNLDQYNRLLTERERIVKELQGVECRRGRDHDHTSEDCELS